MIPVAYGDRAIDRIKAAAPGGIDAFIDTHGGGYVELALALGVTVERIDTIADFAAAAKYGVETEPGTDARPGAIPRRSCRLGPAALPGGPYLRRTRRVSRWWNSEVIISEALLRIG